MYTVTLVCGNYANLAFFPQKFRESDDFTKEITKQIVI